MEYRSTPAKCRRKAPCQGGVPPARQVSGQPSCYSAGWTFARPVTPKWDDPDRSLNGDTGTHLEASMGPDRRDYPH
jgi:hypothetical protein